MIFEGLMSRSKQGIFLGAPEAEAEANANSRMRLNEVYEDYHDLLPGLTGEKFIVVGRKGSGKSAVGEFVHYKARSNPNLFCEFVKKGECNLQRAIQIGKEMGHAVDGESLFRWIILTNLIKMFVDNPAIEDSKEYGLLKEFLKKNSGYIRINELEVKELIKKHGFNVSVEQFRRFFNAKFSKNIEFKAERAPYYKLLDHLEEVVIKLLRSPSNAENRNSFVLFFDDLDLEFSAENPDASQSLMDLIRACRYVNNEVFGKNEVAAKAILLIRDDIEAHLASRFADSAKIFASYAMRINWYQEEFAGKNEDELALKKFVVRRIRLAFGTAGLPVKHPDPWQDLVGPGAYDRSSFKHVVSQTLFRPRDLLLYFQPLDVGKYTFPLSRGEVNTLTVRYSEELAKEIKNELATFYSPVQVETIFKALGEIALSMRTYSQAIAIIDNNCVNLDKEQLLSYLFNRSLIGTVDAKGWYSFACRSPIGSPASLDHSQNIVVQYGIKTYLQNRGYR
jgi:hypothetical protein